MKKISIYLINSFTSQHLFSGTNFKITLITKPPAPKATEISQWLMVKPYYEHEIKKLKQKSKKK